MQWTLLKPGRLGGEACCAGCGSLYVRVSRHRTPWYLRIFNLVFFRCDSCRRRFLGSRRWLSRFHQRSVT